MQRIFGALVMAAGIPSLAYANVATTSGTFRCGAYTITIDGSSEKAYLADDDGALTVEGPYYRMRDSRGVLLAFGDDMELRFVGQSSIQFHWKIPYDTDCVRAD
jgi:hypothetical protein